MLHGLAKNEPRRAKDDPKRIQETPRCPQKRPEATQDGPKRSPRDPKKRSQTARRKKDETTTIPRLSWTAHGSITTSSAAPPGLHLGHQNGTKSDSKMIKNRTENSRRTKSDPRRSWTRLGAILGRFWRHLG